ncbi:protein YgfX [Methylocaldum szegediense]|uniref:Toxin CptA n=1 Tax=Methylocaldum szegediense TaxID=73780 RepID=A0ABN8XC75_9GAMM|nr:protein YgfX [Methylocaldum szegediense]CAI8950386.1 toxin CptA [Methylocaldum szegediense]
MLAGFSALANPLPLWVRFGTLAAVALSLYRWWRAYWVNPDVREVVLKPGGECEIVVRSGAQPGTVLDSSFITTAIVVLHIRTETKTRFVVVCRDSTDSESFRMLRVYLRCRY